MLSTETLRQEHDSCVLRTRPEWLQLKGRAGQGRGVCWDGEEGPDHMGHWLSE